MAAVQQRTHERLKQTTLELSRHIVASDKRFELISKTCEARRQQLILIQQDLSYITEALKRLQRICDLQNHQTSDASAETK